MKFRASKSHLRIDIKGYRQIRDKYKAKNINQ